jgi:hypothetical protein
MKNLVAINDKFNNLTVIDCTEDYHVEPSGKKRRKVLVKCDCGEEFKIQTLILKRKGQKCFKCKFNTDSAVVIGQTYTKLEVVGFTIQKKKKMALCKCICNAIICARPDQLVNGITKHCGCQHKANWRGIELLSQSFIGRIIRNAQKRKILFNVTNEYLWQLYQKQNGKCALSGLNIPFGKSTKDSNDASLDRIDSSVGYIEGNIQWVHKDINKMKMELKQNRFIELCKLISNKN